jgi:hypothetical protein
VKRLTGPDQLSDPEQRVSNFEIRMDDHHSSEPGDGSSSYGTPDHDNAMNSSAKDMFSDTDTNLVEDHA